MCLPQKKIDEPSGRTCLPVMCTDSTMRALDDLRQRFPDEDLDNLINHAIQVLWGRTGGPV